MIKKDSAYFFRSKIMDYSALVIVADSSRLPEDEKDYIETERKRGNIRILQSSEKPNIYYFVGIIDYF